eukprot:TRINITY_DN6986_c0_g1_i1.p1 TRINITY_DN6986_c0_g1~~TRINITY_DN6986_c0_g1_i1.p1  ORF type:complete len:202 (+),score=42.76 TRINITY_DN6986_c0_g1_i1:24-629(+)
MDQDSNQETSTPNEDAVSRTIRPPAPETRPTGSPLPTTSRETKSKQRKRSEDSADKDHPVQKKAKIDNPKISALNDPGEPMCPSREPTIISTSVYSRDPSGEGRQFSLNTEESPCFRSELASSEVPAQAGNPEPDQIISNPAEDLNLEDLIGAENLRLFAQWAETQLQGKVDPEAPSVDELLPEDGRLDHFAARIQMEHSQ